MDFYTLIENDILKNKKFGEVIQVILLNKSGGECWNYFTHITFSEKIKEISKREFLTKSPQSINSEYKVIVTKEVIATSDILNILSNVEKNKVWEWKSDRAILDDLFPINPQFVPETDPTGSRVSDNTLVPIEVSLYGSNFIGGYYLFELFSAKNYLSQHLSRDDIRTIQEIMDSCKLGFKLEKLIDRIGNIVCKIPMEVVVHKTTRLSPERGITGFFKKKDEDPKDISCLLQIIIENDNTITENTSESFILSDDLEVKEYSIEPNKYRNIIILTNPETGIIYYSAIRDYSFGSDYYSTIKPLHYCIQPPKSRKIIVDDREKEIELANVEGIGEISIEKEIF